MQLNPPPAPAVAAFAQKVKELTDGEGRVLLAVSGGPDSLAMLLLAQAAMPEAIAAATVDHGLRPEAAEEARHVAALCGKLNVPHAILHLDNPLVGNLQSAARTARYAALQRHAAVQQCRWMATAHHADDQLETVLMRLVRGAGVDGLAGVRDVQGAVIRPLLHFTKAALRKICAECGVAPMHDPSNDNARFDRVAMRQWLAQAAHPFDARRAVRTAAAMADAAQALDWMADTVAEQRLTLAANHARLSPEGLPRALQRRLVLRALKAVQPGYVPRGDALDRAIAALGRGETTTLGDTLCSGGSDWRFQPAPKRRQ